LTEAGKSPKEAALGPSHYGCPLKVKSKNKAWEVRASLAANKGDGGKGGKNKSKAGDHEEAEENLKPQSHWIHTK